MVTRSFIQWMCILLCLPLSVVEASDDTYPGRQARSEVLRRASGLDGGLVVGVTGLGIVPEALDGDKASSALTPSEAFARTQSILEHLGVPAEPDSQLRLQSLARQQTLTGLQAVLPILDPTGTFRKFMEPTPQSEIFEAFQDIGSHSVPDFWLPLASESPELPTDANSFHQRLLKAKSNSEEQPLAGLRIALDPGHMGGKFWDRETGKAVYDGRGHMLSEGVLNLQVALLLEQSFKALGAQVMLTHRELGAVSALDYAKMEVTPYARNYLRDETLVDWFQQLLAAGKAGSRSLFAAVDQSASVRQVFENSSANRAEYFILGDDLVARSTAINAFNADIALVIHFDTMSPVGNPSGVNSIRRDGTKAYVTGAYAAQELSSRESRELLAEHLMDAAGWQASLQLGRAVISRLHSDLKLTYDQGGGGFSQMVEPGVFSRNLAVSRRVTQRALTYIECLFYNDPVEFAALIDAHHPMEISGESHPYSERMVQLTQAIQKAVVGFVRHYGDESPPR